MSQPEPRVHGRFRLVTVDPVDLTKESEQLFEFGGGQVSRLEALHDARKAARKLFNEGHALKVQDEERMQNGGTDPLLRGTWVPVGHWTLP